MALSPGEAPVSPLARPKHKSGPFFPAGISCRPGSEYLVLQKYASHCSYSAQPFCAAASLVQMHCAPLGPVIPSHPYCLLGGRHFPPGHAILALALLDHVNGPRDLGGGDPHACVVLAELNTAT
jgi:hypothetical protein